MLTTALLRFSHTPTVEKRRLTFRASELTKALLIVLALCSVPATAQNVQHSNNSKDLALRHDFSVDPVSLSLNLQLTLGSYSQRGGSPLPVSMRYSSKLWRLDYVDFKPPCLPDPIGCDEITYTMLSAVYGDPVDNFMTEGWSSSLRPPYVMADSEVFNSLGRPCDPGYNCGENGTDRWYLRRIRLRMPDGSIHELMADDNIYYYTQQPTYPLTYVAVDGSSIRYIDQGNGQATTLLPDGSRYITTGYGAGAQFIDRNGNTLTFSSANNTWTDSLGRAIGPGRRRRHRRRCGAIRPGHAARRRRRSRCNGPSLRGHRP